MEGTVTSRNGLKRLAKALATLVVLVCAAAYVAVSWLTAERLTRPTNHALRIDPRRVSPDAQPWSARTADGLTLRGWYLPTSERRRLIILVHGMWSSWLEMAALGRDLHQRGYDVLLFDLRGHGQSDASRLTLGNRERADIRTVMDWAELEGFSRDRVGWLGYSMGASTLLLEAAHNRSIQVAVIDSPYGNLPEVLGSQLSKHSKLPSWFNPGILAAARLIYGVRTDNLLPTEAARSWGDRPLLLIHGEADSIVPVKQAYELARAAGASCLTLTLPGVEHVQAYEADPESYVSVIEWFFADHLSP
jgi:alpha-beta hydrolase superfamily lysophospholipase